MNEAGLPVIGSDAASNSEIFNGSITPSGGTGPYTFALTSPATGSHGTLVLNAATGTYTYTLTTPFDTTPDSATTAAQTEQDKDSFQYTVTDAHGNTATGTILVDIIDDAPTATSHASQNVAGRGDGHRHAGLCRGRRRRDGHAHRRHGAGVRAAMATRRRSTLGRLHQGEGGRVVLVHGGRGDAEPGSAGDGDLTVTDGDGDTATATMSLPGDGRQRADVPARRLRRLTMTV